MRSASSAAQLPAARVLAGGSTADAVRMVAEHEGPWAALGTRLAAERYGCRVLRTEVEDGPENETRFVWLARGENAFGAGGAATAGPACRLEDLDRLLGRRIRRPGVARALPGRVRRPWGQPDPDRVAAPQSRGWATTCSSSTSRAGAAEPSVGAALDGAPRSRRGAAVSGFVPSRLNRCNHGWLPGLDLPRYTGASHGHVSPSATGVRAAHRAPPART